MKWITIIVIALAVAVYAAMNYVEYTLLQVASGGLQSPDLRILGYTTADFAAWQNALGDNGAALYLKWFPNGLDRYFPALFGLGLALLIHQALSQFPRYDRLGVVIKTLLPLFFVGPYVFLDYFENSVIVDLLQKGAIYGDGLPEFASSLTVMKFAALGFVTICLIVFWLAGLKSGKVKNT